MYARKTLHLRSNGTAETGDIHKTSVCKGYARAAARPAARSRMVRAYSASAQRRISSDDGADQ